MICDNLEQSATHTRFWPDAIKIPPTLIHHWRVDAAVCSESCCAMTVQIFSEVDALLVLHESITHGPNNSSGSRIARDTPHHAAGQHLRDSRRRLACVGLDWGATNGILRVEVSFTHHTAQHTTQGTVHRSGLVPTVTKLGPTTRPSRHPATRWPSLPHRLLPRGDACRAPRR